MRSLSKASRTFSAFAMLATIAVAGLSSTNGCGSGDIPSSASASGTAGTGGASSGTTMSSGTMSTSASTGSGGGGIPGACAADRPAPVPETGHPRIWVTSKDIPGLQARAVMSNPAFAEGLNKLATIFDADLATPTWPVDPNHADTCHRCEYEMETFAMMSLLATDQATKDMWANKSRKVLMEAIKQAKTGPDMSGKNGPAAWDYSTSDRSRYSGRVYGPTVDWIYSYLSPQDKADILSVFLRWSEELVHAQKTSQNHPVPVGVFNDAQLTTDREAVRWAGNNYYNAHGRNLTLMALSFDPADDPGGKLGAYLKNGAEAYLYVTDNLMRTDAKGGLMPEGSEYNFSTMEYLGEHMLALETAGLADTTKMGEQVNVCNNPFYRDTITAYYHNLAPGPHPYKNGIPYYNDFVSFGDLEVYKPYDPYFGDYIATVGPLALAFLRNGDTKYYDVARWLAVNMPPGGPDLLNARMQDPSVAWVTLWYFLLLDPAAGPGFDPRPQMPTDYWTPGTQFQFARTSWDKDASYFFWQNEWGTIDHRHADANSFGLYRKGEWLTTERPGYELSFFYSPSHNTISIQNDPTPGAQGIPAQVSQIGSQYPYGHLTDPVTLGRSIGNDYVYVEGNAAAHYNSDQYNAHDVAEASRVLVWLKPDTVVSYDRLISKTAGRFKRVHMLMQNTAMISAGEAISMTDGGQKLTVDALLPAGVTLKDEPFPNDMEAAGNEMHGRVMAESMALDERFLNVLQGTDGAASAAATTAFASSAGSAYDGAVIGTTAVGFKKVSSDDIATVTFSVPSTVTKIIATGFTPSMGYTITKTPNGANVDVTIAKSGPTMSDTGGVLQL